MISGLRHKKAPVMRQHTRPLTSSSWPEGEQLSRYLQEPLAMALVGPAPGPGAPLRDRSVSEAGRAAGERLQVRRGRAAGKGRAERAE